MKTSHRKKEDPKKIQLNKQTTKQQIAAFTMQQILAFTSRTKTNNGSNISRYRDNRIMLFFFGSARERGREKENSILPPTLMENFQLNFTAKYF